MRDSSVDNITAEGIVDHPTRSLFRIPLDPDLFGELKVITLHCTSMTVYGFVSDVTSTKAYSAHESTQKTAYVDFLLFLGCAFTRMSHLLNPRFVNFG